MDMPAPGWEEKLVFDHPVSFHIQSKCYFFWSIVNHEFIIQEINELHEPIPDWMEDLLQDKVVGLHNQSR